MIADYKYTLETSQVKALLSESNSFYEVMNAFDIRASIAFNLDSNVFGFVYVSKKGSYHIVLNGNLSYETQCKTFVHKLKHIVADMPTLGYYIGAYMQQHAFESDKLYF